MCEVYSFIGLYILHTNIMCLKHVWHMNKCVENWNTNLWMNECHMNFTSSYKFVCQMCFQCMISMCEMYKFCMIFIVKVWDVKIFDIFLFIIPMIAKTTNNALNNN